MTDGVRMAGAGLIGRRHVEEGAGCRSTRLAAVVDPAAAVVLTSAGGALGPFLLSDVPVCSGRDGPGTLQVGEAVVGSARTGAPVDLPRSGRSRPRLGTSPPT